MKNYMKVLAIPVGIIFVLSALAVGCKPKEHHWSDAQIEKHLDWMSEKISDKLDLDKSQQETLNVIKNEITSRKSDFMALHSGMVDQLSIELKNENISQENINKIFEEREAKFKELRVFLVSKFAQFHQTLKPEQKTKLYEALEQLKKHRG